MWLCFVLLALSVLTGEASGNQCCVPPEWEGIDGSVTGVVKGSKITLIQGYANFAYSYSRRRINADENLQVNGKPLKLRVINDYNAQTTYMITGSVCRRLHLEGDMFRCTPSNATYSGDFYLGGPSGKLKASSYQMMIQQSLVSLTVTQNGCIPIGEAIVVKASDGTRALSSVGFVNIILKINDTSVFDIPSSCNSIASPFWVPSDEELHFEQKFRRSAIFNF